MHTSPKHKLLYGIGGGVLVVFLMLLLGSTSAIQAGYDCGGWIENGDIAHESIPARGHSCEYKFTGKTGDIVTITMRARSNSRDSNSLDPYLTLYDPYGYQVAYNNNYTRNSKDSQISAYRLVRRGTYTIEATSYLSQSYGSFSMAFDIR